MLGSALKFFVATLLVAGAAAYFPGYGFVGRVVQPATGTTGTTGTLAELDALERSRETSPRIGGATAAGAERAQRTAETGSLTAKIRAKMALDDLVRAAAIDLDTAGSVVTLSGAVASEAERARAVQLTRETDGVTAVTDRLVVR